MRKTPYKITIKPLYEKNNGMYVMDITDVPFKSPYTWIEKISMSLPSGVIAGNHSHKHSEAFLAMTPGLVLYWMDKKKKVHSMNMFVEGKHFFIILPSNVPHAVKNLANHVGIMVKFANEPPGVMKRYTLI
ncbi:MAG TPA: hypothetical protein VEW42_00380 [Candidatus Eisenbacteria bacterium]|nr:hypothetical protein [Candidatus Eisenbacteria bacterium]